MANEQNLIPGNDPRGHKLTVDEAKKGGINSGKVRVAKRTFKEWLERMGELPIKSEKDKAILKDAGLEDEEMISDAIKMFRLNQKANNGDPKAMELLAKLRGQLTNININENHNVEYKPLVDLTKRKRNGQQDGENDGA